MTPKLNRYPSTRSKIGRGRKEGMCRARPLSVSAASGYLQHSVRQGYWTLCISPSAPSIRFNKLRESSPYTRNPITLPAVLVLDLVSSIMSSPPICDEFNKLGLLFRTPQKWQCSIGMFAVSHAFDIGITTALSLGYAFDLDKFETEPPSRFANFVNQIEESRAYWTHPMMLPCLFLITHALRVEYYLRDTISPEVVAIKDYIGVTKAGTSHRDYLGVPGNEQKVNQHKLFVNGRLHRGNAKRLTGLINDLSTWINFTKRSPQWDIQCADFLLDLIDSDQRLRDRDGLSVKCLQEALHYVRNHSEACLDNAESAAAQMQLQLEIVS
jgi:hypothetical protein